MLRTLQLYIACELAKTFLLTAVGLTLVFSMCGLVFNMIEAEVLDAVQVIKILGFVLPIATTVTLPVASLFACAMVYGRFAADSEIDACKASGINIHRLLAPVVGLSLFTAGFTFISINFLIPGFATRLEAMVRRDIQKVAMQALSAQGYLRYGPYVIHAKSCDSFETPSGGKHLRLDGAAFLIVEDDALTSCGTAEVVSINFWPGKGRGDPLVEASMHRVRRMDLEHNQLDELEVQSLNPRKLPRRIEQKPKLLDLPQLFKYRAHPTEFVEIRDRMLGTRLRVRDAFFYRYVVEQLSVPEKMLQLEDNQRRLEIRAKRVELAADDFRPMIDGVTIVERWDGRRRDYVADRCSIRVKRGYGPIPDLVHLKLDGNVNFTDSIDPNKKNEPKTIDLEEVILPSHIQAEADKITDAELLGFSPRDLHSIAMDDFSPDDFPSLGLSKQIHDARISTAREVIELGLKITGIIHSRLAFSVSAFVTLILAAALAIIFRGGQLLTAFVISFIPGLMIIIINIMGRQLAEKTPETALLGIVIIWGGLVLLAIADGIVLTRYLRR